MIAQKKIVVYTSGTFDMFHSNHLKMIKYARGLGDTLIVGVSTDELVSSYKRPPVIPFEERLAILEALRYPDVVIPQRTLDHTEIVKKLNIDVFVVGDDWTGKYDYLKELGVDEEILIIDDIGAENITEFIRDEVLGPIINYREAENLPTFFSSNLSIDDLAELLSNGRTTVDKTKALRIVERIHSLSAAHFLDGENEREYYN